MQEGTGTSPTHVNIHKIRRYSALSNDVGAGVIHCHRQEDRHLENILKTFAIILSTRDKREALLSVKSDRAQLIIDFMYSLLLLPTYPQSTPAWFRKHTLIALRKLSENSMLYPRSYVLSDIIFDSQEDGGGYCDIHKGRWGNGQTLCLKVVRLYQKSDADKLLKLCAREAIIWGQLHHPNILPFYGIYYLDATQKRVCLVSPWQDNGNIVTYLEKYPQAPRKLFCYDVASGLDYLHSENIIHGDLKGLNVLITKTGRACITDFGLSIIKSSKTLGITATTTVLAGRTDRWASPELLEDESSPTRQSDVWALGCVCYEILTRLRPFHDCAKDIHIVRKLIRGDLPARLEEDVENLKHPDGIDQEMKILIWKCWSLDPEARPSSAQVLSELESICPVIDLSEEMTTTSVPVIHQFQDAMRRNSAATVNLSQVQKALEAENLLGSVSGQEGVDDPDISRQDREGKTRLHVQPSLNQNNEEKSALRALRISVDGSLQSGLTPPHNLDSADSEVSEEGTVARGDRGPIPFPQAAANQPPHSSNHLFLSSFDNNVTYRKRLSQLVSGSHCSFSSPMGKHVFAVGFDEQTGSETDLDTYFKDGFPPSHYSELSQSAPIPIPGRYRPSEMQRESRGDMLDRLDEEARARSAMLFPLGSNTPKASMSGYENIRPRMAIFGFNAPYLGNLATPIQFIEPAKKDKKDKRRYRPLKSRKPMFGDDDLASNTSHSDSKTDELDAEGSW